jgi:hypothetical protein
MSQDITIRIPHRIAVRLAEASIEDILNRAYHLMYKCDCQDQIELLVVGTEIFDIKSSMVAVHESCVRTCNNSSSQSTISDDSNSSLEKDIGGIITT